MQASAELEAGGAAVVLAARCAPYGAIPAAM